MSKLIDRLTRLTRGEGTPIGFQARKELSAGLKMQLIARLDQEDAESLAGQMTKADAGLIVTGSKPVPETIENLCRNYNDIAWGCWVGGATRSNVKELVSAGGDFTVFSAADTPLDIVEDKDTGRILEVDSSISEGLLRTANSLPVDAVLVSEDKAGKSLNWEHLMIFHRFADLLSKPLLVTAPADVSAGELQALWDAGVKGIVVDITAKTPRNRLEKLRQAIDGLKATSPLHKESHSVLLPRGSGNEGVAETPDEEEEEEDY